MTALTGMHAVGMGSVRGMSVTLIVAHRDPNAEIVKTIRIVAEMLPHHVPGIHNA